MKRKKHNYCCDAFARATENGTDNESWSSAIVQDINGQYFVGLTDDPMKLCPWCGKLLGQDPNDY